MSEEKIRKLNGLAARAGIEGWVIALLPGRCVIGKPIDAFVSATVEPRHLSPALDYNGALGVQPDPRGRPSIVQQLQVGPLLGLISLEGIDLPPNTPCVAVDLLHERERTTLAQLVEVRLEMLRQLRASLRGITLATPGMTLPPLPGESRR